MLQRQIMYKQMQELQRRQQLQELGDTRSQTYVNQLSSGGQFQPTISGTAVHDSSQMFMLGNMQMMQHGGSNVVQGLPNGYVLSQNQHHSLNPSPGLFQPHFGVSLYGTPAQNIDKNLKQYPHVQGQSDFSGNLLAKNNNGSYMSQQNNFSSEQIDVQNGVFQSGQAFQEKNFFGQVQVQSFNSGSYTNHGITAQRNFSHLESKGRHDNNASLDPLEQKILFDADDNSWGSFTRNSKVENGGLESRVEHASYTDGFPSMQSGSWSALMQSAVAESTSSDTGIQEEWNGLSFQNPEPSIGNQPSNFIDSERPRNNWMDSQSPNTSMFPGSLQSDHQQKKYESPHFQSETFHASTQHSPRSMGQYTDHGSQRKQPIGRSQLIQTSLPSTSIWPGQHNEHLNNNDSKPHNHISGDNGNETRGSLWLHENTSHQMAGGFQKQYDQANHLNSTHKYSPESDQMAPGNNVDFHLSTFVGASSGFNGRKVTGQSENVLDLFKRDAKSNDHNTSGVQLNLKVSTPNELPPTESSSLTKSSNKTPLSGGFSFPVGPADNQTPQPYSFFPSLSMANSNSAFLSSRNVNDFIKDKGHMSTRSSAYSPSTSLDNSQSKTVHSSCHEFPLLENMSASQRAVSPCSNVKTRHDVPSQKSNEISNFFRPNDSAINSGSANEPTNQNAITNEHNVLELGKHSRQSEYSENLLENGSSDHKGSTEMNNSTLLSGTAHNKQDSLRHHSELDAVRLAEQGYSEAPAILESGIDYQHAIVSKKDLYLSGPNSLQVKDKAIINQNDTQNSSISNEASNVTNQSQGSLQMAPSWFKQYGNLKDQQMLPLSNTNATLNAVQPFSGVAHGEFLKKSLTMQVNLANSCQGSSIWPHTNVPPVASELAVLSSDVSNQTIVTSTPKKRKMVVLDMVPWYKEVNYEPSRLQIIGMAGLQWAQASNSIQEVKNEAAIVEDAKFPVVRAKRRLSFTTELTQQVLRSPPAAILREDATDCDCVAHFTARLALGDACSLTGQLPPDTNEVSTEKLQTSNKTSAIDFSKVVEVLIGRVKKIEDNLSRMDKSLSIVDIKVETQDLEKFGIINRFAKFHSKAQQNTVDSAIGPKSYPQRYVIPHPMPRTIPEGMDCLSL